MFWLDNRLEWSINPPSKCNNINCVWHRYRTNLGGKNVFILKRKILFVRPETQVTLKEKCPVFVQSAQFVFCLCEHECINQRVPVCLSFDTRVCVCVCVFERGRDGDNGWRAGCFTGSVVEHRGAQRKSMAVNRTDWRVLLTHYSTLTHSPDRRDPSLTITSQLSPLHCPDT